MLQHLHQSALDPQGKEQVAQLKKWNYLNQADLKTTRFF
jgi:hypothetical protein